MDRTTDILILTASFGNGHNSATQAILEELSRQTPTLRVQAVDLFEITTPRLKETFAGTYDLITRSQPGIYNRFYDLRARLPNNPVDSLMVQLTFERFADHVRPMGPKILISVFPTGAAFASYYKSQVDPSARLITCITDVVDSWEWIHPLTDRYFVPSESVRLRLTEKGVPEQAIRVTGVPVRRSFRECSTQPRGDKPFHQLLILGSAMDSVHLNPQLLEKLSTVRNLRTVIITGKQQSLYRKLTRMNRWKTIEILGYVENIADYMAESDLIISKAGGATIFEAIEMELPLLIQHSHVGQESQNVAFIQEAGIGELVPDTEDLYSRVLELFRSSRSIQRYRRNIRNFKKTINPDQVTPTIIELLTPGNGPDYRVS